MQGDNIFRMTSKEDATTLERGQCACPRLCSFGELFRISLLRDLDIKAMTDFEERPAKKRRFFVDDPPEVDFHPQLPDSPPNDLYSQNEKNPPHTNGHIAPADGHERSAPDGFDKELFEAFVGEKLAGGDANRLKSMADSDTQRGTC